MSTTATISFKEIVKLIHPDYNPGLDNAGEMMGIAKRHRKDTSFLYELAVHWGIIKPTKEVKDDTPKTPTQTAPQVEVPEESVVESIVKDATEQINNKRSRIKPAPRTNTAPKNRDAFIWDAETIAQAEKQRREWYDFRVRNRIFAEGDIIYVRTRKEYVKVTKIGNNRVYFDWNGRTSYAAKKNVRHSGWRIQNEASQSL